MRTFDRTAIPSMRMRIAWHAIAAALSLACATAGAIGAEPSIAVVVGKAMAPNAPLTTTMVVGIFARKRQLWDDRTAIVPVNLPAAHPLRRAFSLWVFKRTPEDMQGFWADQYFHGVQPPPVLASEEAVLRFLASTPGSIGYVSMCSVDKRVEVVAVIADPEGSAACPR
jgi:hypothetical protein